MSAKFPTLHIVNHPLVQHKLTVMRDKKEIDIKVTVGTNKAAQAKQAAAENESRLGVAARALTKEEEKQAETSGLLVTQVSGLAAKAGIREGDILVSANGKLLKSKNDLREECKGSQVLLLVQRDGGRIFIPVRFPAKDAKK